MCGIGVLVTTASCDIQGNNRNKVGNISLIG